MTSKQQRIMPGVDFRLSDMTTKQATTTQDACAKYRYSAG
jgi:hypothetical protein